MRKFIKVDVGGKYVEVPVDESTYADFENQFRRLNPTPLQRKRYVTALKLARASFLVGRNG